jgi:hypothetical protein
MKTNLSQLTAVLEVAIAVFVVAPLLTLGIYGLFPGFETWQTQAVGFPFPVFGHVVMLGISLLAIGLRRGRLADNGITFRPWRYHLDIAAVCFIPVALAGFPLGMGINHRAWGGALILAAVQIGLLLFLAVILRKRPLPTGLGAFVVGMLLLGSISNVPGPRPGQVWILFLTYAVFVGFGEEILYRGYVQSHLNAAFGKPYRFFGVPFGWGAILTALIFGLSHAGILSWALGLSSQTTLAWGFWTFFGGLVFGLVREKTGSILAPALLHGLPQAVATIAMLFI